MTDADAHAAVGKLSSMGILAHAFGLVRLHPRRVTLTLTGLAGLGIAADYEAQIGLLNFLASVFSLVVQYWLTRALLQDLGLAAVEGGRFPAFFALGLLTGLGIVLGLVALIVPGIVLAVRWSISTPALLAGDVSVTDAMRYSWRATTGRFWPILGAFAALYLAGAALVLAAAASEDGDFVFASRIVMNLTFAATQIAAWHAAVAIFASTRSDAALPEVFA